MRNEIKCQGCGMVITSVMDAVKINLDRRGGRAAYMCPRCAQRKDSYYTENNARHGVVKVNKFTFSFELETSASDEKARIELYANKFLPTHDCTVDVEYKSPIYRGLNAPSKQAVTIGKLIESGSLAIDSTCGTHIHVGEENMINPETMDYIRRFYNSIFTPLCDAMAADSESTMKVFGRDFGRWAGMVDMNTSAMNHSNFVNMEHSYTIEYRICKFRDAKQFQNMLKLCKEFTSIIINNFVMHFNDEVTDTKRYPTIREYRLHKAQVTGNKLAKAFKKAAASA